MSFGEKPFTLSRNFQDLPNDTLEVGVHIVRGDSQDLPTHPRCRKIAVFVAFDSNFGIVMIPIHLYTEPNIGAGDIDSDSRASQERDSPLPRPPTVGILQGYCKNQLGMTHGDRKLVGTAENHSFEPGRPRPTHLHDFASVLPHALRSE